MCGNVKFSFGKNWQFFISRYLNDKKIDKATQSLLEFLGPEKIKGKSFIDIGCGSGLFSLCAYRLGASKIISFDADKNAVECCKCLWEKEGRPSHWQIKHGSILDKNFCPNLEKYDVVYSWGVLHHTGDLWKALKNTLDLVNPHGLLHLAIYNKVELFIFSSDYRFGTSKLWSRFKKIYSRAPTIIQRLLDFFVIALVVFICLITFRNPLKKIAGHNETRGMHWLTDMRDWLGGYPYEYATVEEVFNFVRESEFSLEKLRVHNNFRNNEYLFMKI